MAAVLFTATPNSSTLFRSGLAVNNSVYIPFLSNMIAGSDAFGNNLLIVTEVNMQHRDTIQYFLTFDDFISYYYFGKGLGTMSISGMVFSDCLGQFGSLSTLNNQLAGIRGTEQRIVFGNTVFVGVMSAFTLRASSEMSSIHSVDFNIQMDIIDSSMPPATFSPSC